MKTTLLLVVAHALAASSLRIIQMTGDGWVESYALTFYHVLKDAGHDVVLSGTADDKSGTGSTDREPRARVKPCIYDSCEAHSGPTGAEDMDHNLNWVNSFPVTSMRYGIDTFGPAAWGGQRAELAVTGINVGSNMYRSVDRSGTVAGAAYAAERAGLPAIAFSGSSKRTGPWQEDHDDEHSADNEGLVYAHLAARLIDQLISSGPPPYLPRNIFLNVNFPDVRDECSHPDDFHFVLTRIDPSPLEEGDLEWCDSRRLPLESVVLKSPGCFIPVSIADAKTKRTPHDHRQDVVMQRIAGIIACLPYIDPADQEDDW